MGILRRFGTRCAVLVERLESVPVGLWGWLFSISAVVILRNVLGGISERVLGILDQDNAMFFAHAWGFYVAAFLGVALILRHMTGERIERVSAFVLFLTPILLLPPILDFAATAGGGGAMAYLEPATPLHSLGDVIRTGIDFALWSPFGVFFPVGSATGQALRANYGIRIEVMVLFGILVWYVFLKTRSALRIIGAAALLYAGIFVLAVFPYLVTALFGTSVYGLFAGADAVNPAFGGVNTVLSGWFFALVLILALLWFFEYDRKKFLAVWKNIRLGRLLIGNFGMLTAGLLMGIYRSPREIVFGPFDIFLVLLAYGSALFGWLWAVVRNDLADERGDRISEARRALPSGELSREEMHNVSRLSLLTSLIAAFLVGFPFFLLRVVWVSIAYLYSEPPFRLKRLPVLPNIALAAAYLVTLVGGYVMISANSIFDLPAAIVLPVLVGLSLLMEFKNVKDVDGDRVDGIMTIPVLFGLERGKRIIAALGAVAFFLLPLVYPQRFTQLFFAGFALALWYVYAITASPYREWRVFIALAAGGGIVAWLGIFGS